MKVLSVSMFLQVSRLPLRSLSAKDINIRRQEDSRTKAGAFR